MHQITKSKNLNDLSGIIITSPVNGEVLTYDSNSQEWINSPNISLERLEIRANINDTDLDYSADISSAKFINTKYHDNATNSDITVSEFATEVGKGRMVYLRIGTISSGTTKVLYTPVVYTDLIGSNSLTRTISVINKVSNIAYAGHYEISFAGTPSITYVYDGTVPSNLDDLSDISITSPTNGDILEYDSTTDTWVNAANDKMDKVNPTGTGSLSLNRKANTTIGTNSVATGYGTTASGSSSFAAGQGGVASGLGAFVNGDYSTASGNHSHAEGEQTVASGTVSHTEGYFTKANHRSQHVFGEYNIVDTSTAQPNKRGDYVEIVGNGTADDARSNARTLDWSGNETLAGDLTINGSTSVGNAIAGIPHNLDDISDIDLSNPADGQVIKYDATLGKWVNAANGGASYKILTDTLEAGHTSITFTDADILADSIVSCATPAGINPTAMTSTTGSVTFYFQSQAADMVVKAVIF